MNIHAPNSFRNGPDEQGMFGIFGGRFVAETLMPNILELGEAYEAAKQDPAFRDELAWLNKHYTGRPSPLYYAESLTEHLRDGTAEGKGAKIYFKRDELNHTGSHKINNCLGQILLAKRMGKTRIIAETGAGQHGVASATVAARFGLPCVVYMGAKDVQRQSPNVFRMKLLGAEIVPVASGRGTLKDAMNEALRDWVTNVDDTYYLIGTAAGPHPYPELVRDFQSVIGTECREQMLELEGRLPDMLVASVGGGSNAIGLFHPFLDDPDVQIVGVEAGGKGLDGDEHCASLTAGSPGVLAWQPNIFAAGCRRADRGRRVDLRRSRLSRYRAGTFPPERHRPRRIRAGHGHRGAGSIPASVPHRRHHSRPRTGTCSRRSRQTRTADGCRSDHRDEPVRPRRQGRAYGRASVGDGALAMTMMVTEVYDAFRNAGADEPTAKKAAQAMAESRDDISDIKLELKGMRGDISKEIQGIRGELGTLKWMVGVLVAIAIAVFIRTLFV